MSIWRRLHAGLQRLTRPRGADKVVQILHGLAILDEQLDERELAFILAFAKRWGFDLGDTLPSRERSHPIEAPGFTTLHAAMHDYLAVAPPIDQAQQLRDLLTSLVTIDGRICEREELMMEELGRMIDSFVGSVEHAAFEVFISPQSDTQMAALTDSLPALEKQQRPGGDVFKAGSYHSRAYAVLVRSWYVDAGYPTVVEHLGSPVDADS